MLPHWRPRRHGLDVGADHASVGDTVTYVAEGVECVEDLSLLKDKQSTDLNIFMATQLTDAASGCVLLGVSLGCIFSMSRFARHVLAVHSQGSSGNLDALRSQSRIQDPRDWQLRHRIIRMWHYHSHAVEQRNNFNTDTVGCHGSFKFGGANVGTTVTGIWHDSCAISPLLQFDRSVHLVPTGICSGRPTFDVNQDFWEASQQTSDPFLSCTPCTCLSCCWGSPWRALGPWPSLVVRFCS